MIFLYAVLLALSWLWFAWIAKKLPTDRKLNWKELILVIVWFATMILSNALFTNELFEITGLRSLIETK